MRETGIIDERRAGAPAAHTDPAPVTKEIHSLVDACIHSGRVSTAIVFDEGVIRIHFLGQFFDVFAVIHARDARGAGVSDEQNTV